MENLFIGVRREHPIYGWYEIINILPKQNLTIKFDNTGYEYNISKYNVRDNKIRDKRHKSFHQTGEEFENSYGKYKIIQVHPNKIATVKFELTGTEVTTAICNIKGGRVKDYSKPDICGVGYIGCFRDSFKQSKELSYKTWINMIRRCYDVKEHVRHPTYAECTVCEEWHNYQNFSKWFDTTYIINYVLDKDILVKRNKIYSPETCCFVPEQINALFTKRQNYRGDLPIGVGYSESKMRYRCSFTRNKERVFIGTFDTPELAFAAYKEVKESYIKEVANKWKDKIAPNVYEAMMNYEVEITD